MKKIQKKEKGITLIALVLTIIIILILASVSIAMLTGNNGILTQAQNAKNETEAGQEKETSDLTNVESIINEYQNNIKIEQVTDKNPGILEQEDEKTLVINSIEDLVFFSYDVANGNTYEGEIVKLGLNLDFNSDKSYSNKDVTGFCGYEGNLKIELTQKEGFKTIGESEENPFLGEFDGMRNSLIGLNIKSENENQGLFCNNKGSIKKLNIINSKISGNYTVGSIAAINNGEVKDCLAQGVELTTKIGECGGICGKNSGKIEGCASRSDITGIGSIGGIVAVNMSEGKVLSCYNTGNVYANENSSNVGGIVGLSDGNIENCYNTGKVYGKIENSSGGIVGFNQNGIVNNCYNLGIIGGINQIGGIAGANYNEVKNSYNIEEVKSEDNSNTVGAIVGSNNTQAKIDNCYYSKDINAIGDDKGTSSNVIKLNLEEIPDLLNIIGDNFKEDIGNINNGYPILSWQ